MNPATKKILYIDMDGVIADFDGAIRQRQPSIDTKAYTEENMRAVDRICEGYPYIFELLAPIDGAIEAVRELFGLYDVYFLSTPMWNVPRSYTGKRLWLETYFGQQAAKRLILTHRKDLHIGHYLVDDTKRNGADLFKGVHIHYGQPQFPDWNTVMQYLRHNAAL